MENIRTGSNHDVWSVNVEEEYHEESSDSETKDRPATPKGTGRDAPMMPRKSSEERATTSV